MYNIFTCSESQQVLTSLVLVSNKCGHHSDNNFFPSVSNGLAVPL